MEMEFEVPVLKRMYCTGSVKIIAENMNKATELLGEKIWNGTIKETDVEWSEPKDELDSFDVDWVDEE